MDIRRIHHRSIGRYLFLLTAISMVLFMIGCGSGTETPDQVSVNPDKALSRAEPDLKQGPKSVKLNPPHLEFKETEHHFGKIYDGETPSHQFTFKNTGKSALNIERVKAG